MKKLLSKLVPTVCTVLLLGACSEAPGEAASELATQSDPWTIGSRTLPPPAAASDLLRESIANTPQPNVAEHIRTTTLTTPEEITEFRGIRPKNSYGGGIWIAPITRATTFQISVARSEERTALYFGLGFAF